MVDTGVFRRYNFGTVKAADTNVTTSLKCLSKRDVPLGGVIRAVRGVTGSIGIPIDTSVRTNCKRAIRRILRAMGTMTTTKTVKVGLRSNANSPGQPVFSVASRIRGVATVGRLSRSEGVPLFVGTQASLC